MLLEYRRNDELPRLAWCATVRGDRAEVEHGPWVETRDDCFFEGAWNGAFEVGRLDRAHTMVGTGGRVVDDRLVLAPATDQCFFLYTIPVDDGLVVSNSLLFALVRGDGDLDVAYPYYLYDFLALKRLGLRPGRRRVRLADGRRLTVHMWRRISIGPDGVPRRHATPIAPRPTDYASHVDILTDTMTSVFANAGHPDRIRSYSPLLTISRGYDSAAVCSLAAGLGHREAITFRTDDLGFDDSGAENGAQLGLDVEEIDQLAYHSRAGLPEAEFFASNPTGAGSPIASAEERLEGRILVKADNGDPIWDLDGLDRTRNLRAVHARDFSTASMNEFRLRVGALAYDVPATAAVHTIAIHDIGRSPEMARWSIGGDYDRPIPRRIAETAGLARESFGQEKMFGLNRTELKPDSAADFKRFYETADVPDWFRHTRRYLNTGTLVAPVTRIHDVLKPNPRTAGLYRWTMPTLMRMTRWRAADWRRRNSVLYLFHWGVDRTRPRYDV